MNKKEKLKLTLIFTIAYLVFFTIFSVIKGNYEFLYYTIIMTQLLVIIAVYYKKIHLTPHIIIGLAILGFLHVAGGNISINGTRLYDVYLIGNLFRYDNLVHSFGIFVSTFVGYNILKPHLDKRIKYNKLVLSLILILIAMGIGVFNEILEFGAVVFLGAAKAVGDYFNNAIDLFYNLIGATIATFFIHPYHKKQIKK